jgi:hypothetical protein
MPPNDEHPRIYAAVQENSKFSGLHAPATKFKSHNRPV